MIKRCAGRGQEPADGACPRCGRLGVIKLDGMIRAHKPNPVMPTFNKLPAEHVGDRCTVVVIQDCDFLGDHCRSHRGTRI